MQIVESPVLYLDNPNLEKKLQPKMLAKEQGSLPLELFTQAQKFLEIESANLYKLPKASTGNTTVYLPVQLPIVIKCSQESTKARFQVMENMRKFCTINNYTSLIVPSVAVHGNFLIETRLPIVEGCNEKYIFSLYEENFEDFTEAVKQFTAMKMQIGIGDITGGTTDFLEKEFSSPLPRFDNICPYIVVDEKGKICCKIGLVDLGMDWYYTEKIEKKNALSACRTAIIFFPLHFEGILETAQEKGIIFTTKDKIKLELVREGALKRFNDTVGNHLEFLKRKDIKNLEVFNRPKMDSNKMNLLMIALKNLVEEDKQSLVLKEFFNKGPEKNLETFFNKVPYFIDLIFNYLEEYNLSSREDISFNINVSSENELKFNKALIYRTIDEANDNDLFRELLKEIKKEIMTFDLSHLPKGFPKLHIPSFMIIKILKALVEIQEISYFNETSRFTRTWCIHY